MKKKFIDNYINSLLTKGKEKSDKFSEATKKIESNKFSLANSINPKMYIQKKILDESFDCNDFRTSRIQKDCFNGNEKFRKEKAKKEKEEKMKEEKAKKEKAKKEKKKKGKKKKKRKRLEFIL